MFCQVPIHPGRFWRRFQFILAKNLIGNLKIRKIPETPENSKKLGERSQVKKFTKAEINLIMFEVISLKFKSLGNL